MLDQLLWVPETSNRGQASVPWDQPIGSLDQTFLLAQHINSSKLWWRRCSLAAQSLPTCQLFLQTLVRMRGPWAGPDLQALGWHRFSAFWLRSKCSICSYQLNIWYEVHRTSSILNWFLAGDEVSVACYGFVTCRPCIAVPQGFWHTSPILILLDLKFGWYTCM